MKKNCVFLDDSKMQQDRAHSEVWDKVSEQYSCEIDESERLLAFELAHIFEQCNILPPARIIELGCGSGHLSACLAMLGYKVSLLDFSQKALEKAKETFAFYNIEGEFIEGDIFDLSQINGKYDLAWNSGVMEHFSEDNLRKIYNSIMNISKSKFIFMVPNPESISYLMMRYNLQGDGQWPYGMEFLRKNYLEIANSIGYSGKKLGYAAADISKWHFLSTFLDSVNAKMYANMIDDGLLPEEEGYLVVYEIENNNIELIGEATSYRAFENTELLFELSAKNFALDKEIEQCKGKLSELESNLSKDKDNGYLLENMNELMNLYERKSSELEKQIRILKKEQKQYKQDFPKLQEQMKLLMVGENQYKQEASKMEEQVNLLTMEGKQYKQKVLDLEEEISELKEENYKLYEGVEFNSTEYHRMLSINEKTINMIEPRIKNETTKMREYVEANGFSKAIKVHAFCGTFKNVDLITKCKMVMKVALRCVGVKKNFYIDQARMDLRFQNSLSIIDNIVETAKSELPEQVNTDAEKKITQEKGTMPLVKEEIAAYEPKVSVLLPVYNHASFIRNAISGVQNQTYRNWELIIINDGSTDNLLEILEEYTGDPRIKMYTQDNQRLPNTLTNLHNLATGQFVTWTSADNIMEPQMLETLANNLIEHPEASMVFADVAIIDDKGQFQGYGYREMNRDAEALHVMRFPHDTNALGAECDNYINACFMYRAETVKALKGQYSADLEGLEDYDFWLRLRMFGEIIHIKNEKPLYQYRVHANTMSEDLLKNKLQEHVSRSEKMIKYSQEKDCFALVNWHINFKYEGVLKKALDRINYNYDRMSTKEVTVSKENVTGKENNLYVVEEENSYQLGYITESGVQEQRAEIFKGVDISPLAKKVRQMRIFGLFWEYPARFVNMPVVGCHVDMRNIDIDKTISLLNNNKDKLFSFCAVIGGQSKETERQILEKCENAVFVGEKEVGLPIYLYSSWDIAFVPPLKRTNKQQIMEAIICAWNIGRWIMIEEQDLLDKVLPFVTTYSNNETMLGIKKIKNLNEQEDVLDRYIYYYSTVGTAKRVIAFLNGIGQDILVKRPDFKLIPKERKFPPQRLFTDNDVPGSLQEGYIAIVVDTLDKGGLEQVVATLVKELIDRNIEVRVLCTDRGGYVADTLKKKGVTVEEFFLDEKKFEEYILKNRPLLVNTHFTKNMLNIIKRHNIKMVEVIHNMYVFMDSAGWKEERTREEMFDKMIAVSKLVKVVYEKKHGKVSDGKIEVIGNCADTEKIIGKNRTYVRDELGIPQDSTVFINVSSMDGRKNQLGLITAFDMYYKTVDSNSYLILVGNRLSEFYDNAILQYIGEVQAKKNIIKLDFYGSITDLYNAADIFIMPSYFEGWSIAATEALYCGLPIIHSKCGSAIELVRFGQNGLMISNPAGEIENCSTEKLNESMGNRVPVNTNELYSAMKEIATNLLYWKERRSLIASSALQIYSKKSMIDSYIKCFEEIVTK